RGSGGGPRALGLVLAFDELPQQALGAQALRCVGRHLRLTPRTAHGFCHDGPSWSMRCAGAGAGPLSGALTSSDLSPPLHAPAKGEGAEASPPSPPAPLPRSGGEGSKTDRLTGYVYY